MFVHGLGCLVRVQHHAKDQVEIHARLVNAFGLIFVTEQDEAGVYVVVRQRRLVGAISRAEFLLSVPHYTHLALHMTPGTVRLEQFDGLLEIPPLRQV
ncbi:MAG: hypothetical protein HC915_11730 [Anaerolineae bacterium]|nr:hypothetical protein [Anaerolineae bacterium]